MNPISNYFTGLTEALGDGWNRFWYTPKDPLPLCALRVLFGLVAFYTIATYGPDLERFFGPQGVTPPKLVEEFRSDGYASFSYYYVLNSPEARRAGHIAGLVVLGLFTAGVLTRVTSVLALLVLISHFHRAPMIAGPLEVTLSMIAFYLCLAPTGRYLSVDAWLARRRQRKAAPAATSAEPPPKSYMAAISLRLLQLHLCLIWLLMGIAKLGGDAWLNGSAAWWLAAHFETAPFDLLWLKDHLFLVNAWSLLILFFELSFPLLVWNRWARPLMLAAAPVVLLLSSILSGFFAFALLLAVANLVFVPAPILHRAFNGLAVREGEHEAEAAGSGQGPKSRKSDQVPVAG